MAKTVKNRFKKSASVRRKTSTLVARKHLPKKRRLPKLAQWGQF